MLPDPSDLIVVTDHQNQRERNGGCGRRLRIPLRLIHPADSWKITARGFYSDYVQPIFIQDAGPARGGGRGGYRSQADGMGD